MRSSASLPSPHLLLQSPNPTCIQRFGSALNLNFHLHVLIPDGVWVTDAQGTLANSDVRIAFDPATGGLASLFAVAHNREYLGARRA